MGEEILVVIKALYDSFINGEASDEEMMGSEILEKVHGAISRKMNILATTSRTAKLWIQYIHYINIVKLFIAAERTGNWQNHLGSTAQMLNLFAATGHINYAKSARLYLQMMANLPSTFPDLHNKFSRDGYHVPYCDKFLRGFIFASAISLEFCVDLFLRTRSFSEAKKMKMKRCFTNSRVTAFLYLSNLKKYIGKYNENT